MNPQGCSIRELGDTSPLSSKKAEEASATARGRPERALPLDYNWIAFQESLAVQLGFLADSAIVDAVRGLGAFGEDLPNAAFGDALEVVRCHLAREEEEQGQHRKTEYKSSDQLDERL